MIQTQPLFGTIIPNKKGIKAKKPPVTDEKISPFYNVVMQIGQECGYCEIEVNDHLIIGEGAHMWRAYAENAIEKRIEQIKCAVREVKQWR